MLKYARRAYVSIREFPSSVKRVFFFFSSRRRHTRLQGDWSSDVCSSDLGVMDTAKVERVYTSYARVYDHIFGKIFHDGREHAVRLLNLSRGERVLEVGVGTGLALPFYPRTCEVVGIDLSAGMLARCRHRGWELGLAHVSLQRMDASAMEFLDDRFDAVMAAYVVTAEPAYPNGRRGGGRERKTGGTKIRLYAI